MYVKIAASFLAFDISPIVITNEGGVVRIERTTNPIPVKLGEMIRYVNLRISELLIEYYEAKIDFRLDRY